MSLSGWCSQRGIPDCAGCRWDGCSHECHGTAKNKAIRDSKHPVLNAVGAVDFGADKRSPSRVLGRSATEASTDQPAKEVIG